MIELASEHILCNKINWDCSFCYFTEDNAISQQLQKKRKKKTDAEVTLYAIFFNKYVLVVIFSHGQQKQSPGVNKP